MEIAVDSEPTTRIALTGRFDAFERDAFTAACQPLVDGDAPHVTVDLSNVEFVDSSGLAALVSAMKRAREQGGDLVLANPSDPVTVILELTRLDAAFDIVRT